MRHGQGSEPSGSGRFEAHRLRGQVMYRTLDDAGLCADNADEIIRHGGTSFAPPPVEGQRLDIKHPPQPNRTNEHDASVAGAVGQEGWAVIRDTLAPSPLRSAYLQMHFNRITRNPQLDRDRFSRARGNSEAAMTRPLTMRAYFATRLIAKSKGLFDRGPVSEGVIRDGTSVWTFTAI